MKPDKEINPYDYSDELRSRGITFVTGESCGIGMRILYDLTPEAADLIGEFLGGAVISAPAWGRETYSIMLPPEWTKDILVYLLLQEYEIVVVRSVPEKTAEELGVLATSSILCYEKLDSWNRGKVRMEDGVIRWEYRAYWRQGTARDGNRNVHHWTGRVT